MGFPSSSIDNSLQSHLKTVILQSSVTISPTQRKTVHAKMHLSTCSSSCLFLGLLIISATTVSAQFSLQSLGLGKFNVFGRQSSTPEPSVSVPIQEELDLSTTPPTPEFQIVTASPYRQLPIRQQSQQVQPYRTPDVEEVELPSQILPLSQVQQSRGPSQPLLGQQLQRPDSSEEYSEIVQTSDLVSQQQLASTAHPPGSIHLPQISPPRWQERPQIQPPRYQQSTRPPQRLQVEPEIEILPDIHEGLTEIQQLSQTQRPVVVTQSSPLLQRPMEQQRPQVQVPKSVTQAPALLQQQQDQRPALIQQKPAPIQECCTSPVLSQQLEQVLTKLESMNNKIDGLTADLAKAQETLESQNETIEQLRNSSQSCVQKQQQLEHDLQEFARIPPTINSLERLKVRQQAATTLPPFNPYVKG